MACERTARRVLLALTLSDCWTKFYCGSVINSEPDLERVPLAEDASVDMAIFDQM